VTTVSWPIKLPRSCAVLGADRLITLPRTLASNAIKRGTLSYLCIDRSQAFEAEGLSASIHAVQRAPAETRSSEIIPIRFVPANRPSRADRLRAAFDALVLSKAVRQTVPCARIIYGDTWATTKVHVAAHFRELTKITSKLKTLLAAEEYLTLLSVSVNRARDFAETRRAVDSPASRDTRNIS
jgi:hypothetical protein